MTRRKDESVEAYRERAREKARIWRASNPGYAKKYRDSPVNRAKRREHTRQFKLKNPDYHYEHMFGMLPGQYASLFAKQRGVCAICAQPENVMRRGKVARLSVDHCHKTGRVRGLLCGRCNPALGLFKDNPDLLRKAAEYIEVVP